MKSTRIQAAKLSLILLPLLLTFGTKSAIAQITPANDGTGTIVNTQNNQISISGGTQAGTNQFHSFQQFGVNAGQTANFLSNPNIANILGRVTGGDASLINGMLKVSGSNANLYLMNPAGIVFGKDASLNIPAAFTATTANGIGFGNGNWFNSIGSNNYATLTANPTSFSFSGLSGSIINAGNLSVNSGQSIALIGGTVVNTGTIAAPGGNITIAAIPGSKMVRIGQEGTVLSLDLPTSDRALINAPIATPLSLPALLTGGSVPSAIGVVVEDGVIKLTGGSASVTGTLNADGTGLQNGGNVVAYADNHLDFGGTVSAKGGELGGNGGFVDTSGKGSIAISPNAKVVTTAAKGLTGTWLIDPADLEVVAGSGGAVGGAGSTIGAGTIVAALNSSNVNLQADNSITVNEAIEARGNTNAGNLTLTAPTTNLNQAITLQGTSTLSGTAATVNVGAAGTVQNGVDVSAIGGTVNLAAATYRLTQEVSINKNVTVRGAGAGITTVSGNNAVRVFNIGSAGNVNLDGMSIVNGKSAENGGGVNYSGTGTLNVSRSLIESNTGSQGGGIANNSSGTLNVSESTIDRNLSTSTVFGLDGGGGIFNISGTFNINSSSVTNNVSKSNGGGITNGGTVTINNTIIQGNDVSAGLVGGGVLNYSRSSLTLNNSAIISNIGGRNGGGGIMNEREGTVVQTNTTISGNTANNTNLGGGGGILNVGAYKSINSTITNNSANGFGGGVYTVVGTFTALSTIISGNTNSSSPDVAGTFIDQGSNLIGKNNGSSGFTNGVNSSIIGTIAAPIDPKLAPLANNGGPTQTHALLSGSPAIDAGNATNTLTIDQRGGQRGPAGLNAGTRIDIGAYESTSSAVVVNTLDTIGAGSLRAAINLTNGNYIDPITNSGFQAIRFNIGTVGSAQTIALTSALPAIIKDTTIDGWTQGVAGYAGVPLITISGENKVQVFDIRGATVGMNGLAIVNGSATQGGGIYNDGNLTIDHSVISGNRASQGGGLQNDRTLIVNNSTISGNSSGLGGGFLNYGIAAISNSTISGNSVGSSSGGGITNFGTLTVRNSTISGNAAGRGGGIAGSTLTISNSIISGNTATLGEEINLGGGTFTSNGYNLFGHTGNSGFYGGPIVVEATDITPTAAISTILAPLGNYGGPTQTHALLPGSAAIDAGNAASTTLDQRGKSRFGTADIGAFESQGFTFAATAGTPQNIVVGQAGITPLTVKVTANNAIEPVAGGIVNFTAPIATVPVTANATLGTAKATIDASGNASTIATANTKIGTYTVKAGIAGIATTADFSLTNLADVANSIVTTSGSGQSAVVENNFTNNLVATVVDKYNNPVSGATVSFSATTGTNNASGIFTTSTATTDIDGKATIAITANKKAGGFIAIGNVSGVTAGADFNLTNKADIASQVTTTSGSGQTTTVNTSFTDNLVVTVTDQFGNPIEGTTVTFSTPNSGASSSFISSTATTDIDGKATIAPKANTKAGTYTATGTIIGIPAGADFTLTNKADAPTQTITTNTNQNTTVGNLFSRALQVRVLDQYGNPVTNNSVTLTLPSRGASGIFAGGSNTLVLTTDSNGMITTPLRANLAPGTYTGIIQVQGNPKTTPFTFTNDSALMSNLEAKEIRNPRPSIAPTNPVLCVDRSAANTSSSKDAYQGVPTCGATKTQRKAIDTQAKTDR